VEPNGSPIGQQIPVRLRSKTTLSISSQSPAVVEYDGDRHIVIDHLMKCRSSRTTSA
jgi:hypothetical protein